MAGETMDRERIERTVNELAKSQWFDKLKARKKLLREYPDCNTAFIEGLLSVAHEEWVKNAGIRSGKV